MSVPILLLRRMSGDEEDIVVLEEVEVGGNLADGPAPTAEVAAAATTVKTDEEMLDMTTFLGESERLRNLSGAAADEEDGALALAANPLLDGEDEDAGLYVPLPKEELERQELGIGGASVVTSVGVGAQVRKKETFFCDLCEVQLNSRDTMRSHALGERHAREREACLRMVEEGRLEAELVIRQIKNPDPVRVKVPVRLQAKLRETAEPVVGLEAVAEFIPISNKEMEPYYQCHLCDNIGEANGMFNHVLRPKHQEAFFEAKVRRIGSFHRTG